MSKFKSHYIECQLPNGRKQRFLITGPSVWNAETKQWEAPCIRPDGKKDTICYGGKRGN